MKLDADIGAIKDKGLEVTPSQYNHLLGNLLSLLITMAHCPTCARNTLANVVNGDNGWETLWKMFNAAYENGKFSLGGKEEKKEEQKCN